MDRTDFDSIIKKEISKIKLNVDTEEKLFEEFEEKFSPGVKLLVPYVYYYDTDKFLKDSFSQTEETLNETHVHNYNCCCNYGTNYETISDENNLIFSSDGSYTKFNSDIDTELLTDSPLNDESLDVLSDLLASTKRTREITTQTERRKPVKKVIKRGKDSPFGWVYSRQSDTSDSDLAGFLFDEDCCNKHFDSVLSSQNLLNDEKLSKNYDTFKSHEGNAKNVLERVSKIGWTYNSPTNLKCKENEILEEEKIENICTDDNNQEILIDKKLCNIEKRDLKNVKDNKDVCPEGNLKEVDGNLKEKNYTEEKEQCSSSNMIEVERNNSDVPLNSLKCKKSLFKVAKIPSKIDFSGIFQKKKKFLRNSSSADQVESSVKYKKIHSAKSTLF